MTARLLLSASFVAALAGGALAHHGWGEYDATKVFTISSPLEQVSPGNPHVTVAVKHGGRTWTAVLAPTSRMNARGLPPESLKPGLAVQLEGYPAKNGVAEMRAERITVAGKTTELR